MKKAKTSTSKVVWDPGLDSYTITCPLVAETPRKIGRVEAELERVENIARELSEISRLVAMSGVCVAVITGLSVAVQLLRVWLQ